MWPNQTRFLHENIMSKLIIITSEYFYKKFIRICYIETEEPMMDVCNRGMNCQKWSIL